MFTSSRRCKKPWFPFRPRLEILEDRTLLSVCTVDRLTDNDPPGGGEGSDLAGDLRYCITQAVDGYSIQFSVTGTINLAGMLPDLTHRIKVQGPGADQLTVRRDTGGDYRIFTVAANATVQISGLTITNGSDSGGGGGGIRNSGTLTVNNSTISGNTANGSGDLGGGIYNGLGGTFTISNSTVSGNSSRGGGAILNKGTLVVSNSTVSGNTSTGQRSAGGIANDAEDSDATVLLLNCTVSNNTVTSSDRTGSQLFNGRHGSGNATVQLRNTITSGDGSRPNLFADSEATVVNFDDLPGDNIPVPDGYGNIRWGGEWIYYSFEQPPYNPHSPPVRVYDLVGHPPEIPFDFLAGPVTFEGAWFAGWPNSSVQFRLYLNGTLVHTSETLTTSERPTFLASGYDGAVDRVAVFANHNQSWIMDDVTYGRSATFVSQGHNVSNDDGSGFLTGDGDLTNTDPRLGPLQNNGGPTQTMALQCGSPAIDAGDNTNAPDWDQRGEGYPRIVNGIIDIGSYEVQKGECGGLAPHGSSNRLNRLIPIGLALDSPLVPISRVANVRLSADLEMKPIPPVSQSDAATPPERFSFTRPPASLGKAEDSLFLDPNLDCSCEKSMIGS